MKTYKEVPRFSEKTGEQIGTRFEVEHVVCDYCGTVFDYDDTDSTPYVTYTINEVGGSEPSFEGLRSSVDFDLYELFGDNEFFYCQEWPNDKYCEQELMKIWTEALAQEKDEKEEEDTYNSCLTIADSMYLARIEVAKKLLKEGFCIFPEE